MRGTKKLPVDTLQKLYDNALEKFNEVHPEIYQDFLNNKINEVQYYREISNAIYKIRDDSWFTRFKTGLSRSKEYLARYWEFKDFNQSILEHLYEYVYGRELDEDRIKRINRAFKINEGDFVHNSFFVELETECVDVEVNCISADLSWLVNYIDKIIIAAENNGAVFKYIAVNPIAKTNMPIIKQKLANMKCENVIIKEAYDKLKLIHDDKLVGDSHGILFPLNDDIVIYKNIPLYIQEKNNIKESILASGTDIFDRTFERRKQDFIIPDNTKLLYTQMWFDSVWNSID